MGIKEKEVLNNMSKLCDAIADKVELDLGDGSMSHALTINAFNFLAYLAASDGMLSWNECRYISDLFDMNITPNKLDEFIREKDIYSVDFEQDIPLCLKFLVSVDNATYEADIDMECELGETFLETFVILGMGLVKSNGRDSDTMETAEKEDFETYLGMMKRYIDENTEKHHVDLIVNYIKSGSKQDVDDEDVYFTGAVKAPRKKA